MKHRIFAAAGGCGGCILLICLSPFFSVPAIVCLVWLAALALKALRDSETDPLTGLGNLRQLERRRGRFEKAPRLTVGYFDIDRLKHTNDTRGHATGDTLLQAAAERLSRAAGEGDLVCRVGGDEFLLVSEQAGTVLAQRWEAETTESLPISCGWAEGTGRELDALIQKAEQNMYGEKNHE